MELGMIGLGRMGANMTERLVRGGHRVIGFDPNPEARARVEGRGAGSAASLEALVGRLEIPRAVWLMVPAGDVTDRSVAALAQLLAEGDTLVDGGNSNYKDTLRRAALLAARRIHYVDCGTSGGVWGLAEGYSMMIGGRKPRSNACGRSSRPWRRRLSAAGAASARADPATSPRWSTTESNTG